MSLFEEKSKVKVLCILESQLLQVVEVIRRGSQVQQVEQGLFRTGDKSGLSGAEVNEPITEEQAFFDMLKNEVAKRSRERFRPAGGNTRDSGHKLRNKAVVLQGRLKTDVGGALQLVGNKIWMGRAFPVWFSKRIESAAELEKLSGLNPPGKLASEVGWISRAGQQETGMEHRFVADDF
jgi:hypothetical protein